MYKHHNLLWAALLLLGLHSVGIAETENQNKAELQLNEQRQLVEMPSKAQQVMRQHMLEHLATLNQIIGLIAEDKLEKAASLAETKIGISSMGKQCAKTGMGPGLFMPPDMRQMGRRLHEASSEFARIAKEGDTKQAVAALQKVTTTCVACHYKYRIQ